MPPYATPYKTLHDPALVKALAHPLRAKILYELQDHEASPKNLAAHFGIPLSNVAYHIQVLRKLKLIRLVRKTPRRGAIEHRYKADHAAVIDDDAWSQTPGLVKERMVAAELEEVGRYVMEAAATGGFNRGNGHLSRTRLVLDGPAWDVLADKLKDVWDLAKELEKESTARLRKSNHEDERRTGLVMMLFESMAAVPDTIPEAVGPQDAHGDPLEQASPAA
jgi:DNA-binding transcriptional ArsR family regulator